MFWPSVGTLFSCFLHPRESRKYFIGFSKTREWLKIGIKVGKVKDSKFIITDLAQNFRASLTSKENHTKNVRCVWGKNSWSYSQQNTKFTNFEFYPSICSLIFIKNSRIFFAVLKVGGLTNPVILGQIRKSSKIDEKVNKFWTFADSAQNLWVC